MYDSAHMISSKTMSHFLGFPMPQHYPDYPNHRHITTYLRTFADAYRLTAAIRFNTDVKRAEKHGDEWIVKLSDGSEHRYDA